MIKICYVVTIPGTIESFFIPQLKYLAVNGFDVTVVCSNSVSLQMKLGNSIKFYPIDIPRGISLFGSVNSIKRLIKFFKKERFALIQYSTPNAAFYASIASKVAGCKVRNYHCMGFRYLGVTGITRRILKLIEKITCNLSTSIECVSNSNLRFGVKEKLFEEGKATVVWNGSTGGVDLSRFDYRKREQWRKEIRDEQGFREHDFIYGYVGRITKDKGINELLKAFLSMETCAKLFLIGKFENDGSLDRELLEKARNNSNVKFHDSVYDIERYYAAIDVLILPSYREGFGNVVIEAGAMGTPAIVSDIPGPTDTIEKDKTAFVVPVKNSEALIDAMYRIRSADYKAMGQNATEFVQNKFDSRILCEEILKRKKQLLD